MQQLTHNPAAMPMLNVEVQGKTLKFMVDSGAGYSVIRVQDLNCKTQPGKHKALIGVGMVKEKLSVPLRCSLDLSLISHCFFFFIISSTCPVNLLARYLMCKLGCNLISSPTGLSVEFENPCMVQIAPGAPGYAYMWRCV